MLRRSDFRESSRIVTLLTRDHGRVTALAKGAHRPDSPFLGRIDFLNEVRATFSADRGGLRLFVRVELVRERRALREPLRFFAAGHAAWLGDFAMPDERPDPLAYDLLVGGLNLVERCPPAQLPLVALGLEVRHLEHLGALPDLERCAHCGVELGDRAFRGETSLGLLCRTHGSPAGQVVDPRQMQLLRALRTVPGRDWPSFAPACDPRSVAPLTAAWLWAATGQHSRWRQLVFGRQPAPESARGDRPRRATS